MSAEVSWNAAIAAAAVTIAAARMCHFARRTVDGSFHSANSVSWRRRCWRVP